MDIGLSSVVGDNLRCCHGKWSTLPAEKQRLPKPSKLLFLPGASGNTAFWQPLANQLTTEAEKVILGYPGFGEEPPASNVNDFDALVRMVVSHIDQPTALIVHGWCRRNPGCAGKARRRHPSGLVTDRKT
jgi:hypothetical protein